MAYLALYRRYRPTSFESLIGQDHISQTLKNQIINDRLGHAYLFTGTRGTGKTSAAKIFAKAINCLTPVNGSPCGKCEACLALSDLSNIDVVEIDAASNNGVNEIRDLREKVQYPPVSCRYKVYIIDEVHMLTGAAFNALLKTLEEPPKHAVFILATTEVHKIPATILSRCMRFDFRLIPTKVIADLISKIYDEQGKKYEKEAVFAIAKSGEGSIRDALSIADTALSYGDGVLTYNDVMEIIGSSNSELLINFVDSILKSDTGSVLKIINELTSMGKSIGVLIKDVTSLIRNLIIVKTCNNPNAILSLPETELTMLNNLVKETNQERLIRVLNIFTEAETTLRYSTHQRTVFETVSIKASKPDSDYDIDALMARIKELEDKFANINKYVKPIKSVSKTEINTTPIEQTTNEALNSVEKKVVEKLNFNDFSIEDVKGKLLLNLRKNNSEIMWTVLQTVQVSKEENTLIINTDNKSDYEFLSNATNLEKIKVALEEFKDITVKVNLSEKEKALEDLDDATERMKKIFGDDIIIVK